MPLARADPPPDAPGTRRQRGPARAGPRRLGAGAHGELREPWQRPGSRGEPPHGAPRGALAAGARVRNLPAAPLAHVRRALVFAPGAQARLDAPPALRPA